jgi:hypothetical protein
MLTMLVRLQVLAALVIIPIHFMDSINPKRVAPPPVANPIDCRGAEAVQSAWNAVKSQYAIPSADGRFRRPSLIKCNDGVWTIEGQVETERGLISYKKQVRANDQDALVAF